MSKLKTKTYVNGKLVDQTGESTTNIWADDWHPEVIIVCAENLGTVDH